MKAKREYPVGWSRSMAVDISRIANCSPELVRAVATKNAKNEVVEEMISKMCKDRLSSLDSISNISSTQVIE